MLLYKLKNVEPGMVIGKSIYDINNRLILAAGHKITPKILERFNERGYNYIYIMFEGTEEVITEEMTLEKAKMGKENPEFVPNADTSAVNLEHVMPRNPEVSWDIEPDTHRAFVNRLGNLAILSNKLNSNIGNSSFDIKKDIYKKSSFELTKELSEYSAWNTDTISQRQETLADLALKTWKI